MSPRSSPSAEVSDAPRGRWLRRLRSAALSLACILLLLAVSWKWLLTQAALTLIHDDPVPAPTLVVSIGGAAGLERAALLLAADPHLKLLLSDQTPTRVEELGVMQDDLQQTLAEIDLLKIDL